MGLVKEFKEFAMKGNVVDLAVGVIIGASFGKIVGSMIDDVIMPVIGMAGKADFSNLYFGLNEKVRAAVEKAASSGTPMGLADARKEGPVLAYGSFITVVINFLIVAFCIFLIIKAMNAAKKAPPPAPAAPPPPTKEQVLLTEIRDALRAR